ncbi:MAG: O-antigen ligase family protein [bacterium]|nr:O-antigen ligase family protein [bacterium]
MPYATFVLQAVRHGFDVLGMSLGKTIALGTKSWKEFLLGILVICVLGYILRYRQLPFRMHAMDWLMLLFIVYGVLVGGAIVHNGKSVVFGFRYDFAVFIFYFVARCFWSNFESLLRVLKLLTLAALPMLVFGVAQVFLLPRAFLEHFGYSYVTQVGGNPLPPYHLIGNSLVRAMSTFPGPNSLAMYAGFLLLISLFFGRRWFPRRWWVADLVLISVVLVTTYSRTHMLSLLVGAAMYGIVRVGVLRRSVRRLRVAVLTFFFSAIVAAFLLSVLPIPNPDSPSTIQALVFHNSSSILHRNARLDAWEQIRKHPWGRGLGTSGLATTNTGGLVRNPESWYVQVTQEFGWPGLVLALTVIGGVLAWLTQLYATQKDSQHQHMALFFLVSFTAVAISAQFLPTWFEVGSITWWLIFGLYVSAVDRESIQSSARIPRDQSAM